MDVRCTGVACVLRRRERPARYALAALPPPCHEKEGGAPVHAEEQEVAEHPALLALAQGAGCLLGQEDLPGLRLQARHARYRVRCWVWRRERVRGAFGAGVWGGVGCERTPAGGLRCRRVHRRMPMTAPPPARAGAPHLHLLGQLVHVTKDGDARIGQPRPAGHLDHQAAAWVLRQAHRAAAGRGGEASTPQRKWSQPPCSAHLLLWAEAPTVALLRPLPPARARARAPAGPACRLPPRPQPRNPPHTSMRLRAWMASGDRQKMGMPAPSDAKSTSVPKGYPARLGGRPGRGGRRGRGRSSS